MRVLDRDVHWLTSALVALCIGLTSIILLDAIALNPISPWHDEIWNIYPGHVIFNIKSNIWPGCQNLMCINVFGYKLPILSGPYHGVIKTLIFSPLSLTGSPGLIRLFNILVYILPSFYILTQMNYLSKAARAFLLVSYFFLFPALLFEAIFDQEQFIIVSILLSIAALSLAKDQENHNPARVAFVVLLCALAIYEKLTTIPVASALGLCAAMRLVEMRSWRHLLLAGFSLVVFVPYLRYLLPNAQGLTDMTSVAGLPYLAGLRKISETAVFYLFVEPYTAKAITGISLRLSAAPAVSVVLLLWLSAVAVFRRRLFGSGLLLLLSPVVAIALFPLIAGLNRPWHVYQLAPLAMGPLAILASYTDTDQALSRARNAVTPIIALIAVIVLGNLVSSFVNRPRLPGFDGSLFGVVDAIKNDNAARSIMCPDYSVCYQTAFMLGGSFRIAAEHAFSPPETACPLIKSLPKPFYLIANPSGADGRTRGYPDTFTEFLHIRSDTVMTNCQEILTEELPLPTRNGEGPRYRVFLIR